MTKWLVVIRQYNAATNAFLNEFNITVDGEHRLDAKNNALSLLESLNRGWRTDHSDYNSIPYGKVQSPSHKLGWQGAKNRIVSIKRVNNA